MHGPKTKTVNSTNTRYGKMSYYGDDQYIGHALETYGEYSKAEPDLWRKFLKPGDYVVEAGANIGALTLALSSIVGETGKVTAFEPQPENYDLLRINTDAARYDNIDLEQLALGDHEGTIKVLPLANLPHTNYGAVELGDYGTGDDGQCATISRLDSCYKEARLDFIKIDVEGMESQVLRGAKNIINYHRPVLYVENDRPEKAEELLRTLIDLDYELYVHLPLLYDQNNYKDVTIDEQNIISINLLCVPHELDTQFAVSGILAGLNKFDRQASLLKINAEIDNKSSSNKAWACVVRLGGIGDNLIAASTLRPLKAMGYMIEVITKEPQSCVFENNPFIDKLTVKSDRELPQDNPTNWQKYWWSRSCEFAKFVNLSHSVEVLMARFPAETAFWWPPEFRRKVCGHSYLEAAHDVVGVPHEFGKLFFPTEAEQLDIAEFKKRHGLDKKPLIGWVVSGTRVDKIYPFGGMAISRLLAELDVNIIMMSSPSTVRPIDASHAEQIMNHVKLTNSSTEGLHEVRHIEGSHNWPIRRMLTLSQSCDLVIGPDSGIMWAVAMEQTPKIVLHSHASADNITKHWHNTLSLHADRKTVPCWPCHLLHDTMDTCLEMQIRSGMKPSTEDIGSACIRSIDVQTLMMAAKVALGKENVKQLGFTNTHTMRG